MSLLASICILLIISLMDKSVSKSLGSRSGEIDLSSFGNEMFGLPDKSVGELLANLLNDTDSGNPEELGSYLEGDILFLSKNSRNGKCNKSFRWKNGVIPYEVVGNFGDEDLDTIQKAMDAYHENTCIKFVAKDSTHEDYISIRNTKSGCWSSVGRTGGLQVVNLQDLCLLTIGTPIHELMHVVGFTHEQNREDRDANVKIIFQNIEPDKEHNFQKAIKGTTSSFGVPYDYNSVMHYSEHAFSKNNRPTIMAKKSFHGKMGQRDGFSKGDIGKIRRMYKCTKTTSSSGYQTQVSVTPMDTSGEIED